MSIRWEWQRCFFAIAIPRTTPAKFVHPSLNVHSLYQATALMAVSDLLWRYAVKRFDSTRTIDSETWAQIEQSLVVTPSSFGLQPWKFFVIKSPEVKAKLSAISWNQSQPSECSHMVALAAMHTVSEEYVDRFFQRASQARKVSADSMSGYRDIILGFLKQKQGQHLVWSTNQVYIALGQLMATAASLKVDACPMEGIVASEYDKLLGLEGTEYRVVVGCALGYRHNDDKYALAPKVRFEANEVIQYI
jgi:nitroreductase